MTRALNSIHLIWQLSWVELRRALWSLGPTPLNLTQLRAANFKELRSDEKFWAKLPYCYCLKNVSGYRRHPRSVVAYSAEVAHRAVTILNIFRTSRVEFRSVQLSWVALSWRSDQSAQLVELSSAQFSWVKRSAHAFRLLFSPNGTWSRQVYFQTERTISAREAVTSALSSFAETLETILESSPCAEEAERRLTSCFERHSLVSEHCRRRWSHGPWRYRFMASAFANSRQQRQSITRRVVLVVRLCTAMPCCSHHRHVIYICFSDGQIQIMIWFKSWLNHT